MVLLLLKGCSEYRDKKKLNGAQRLPKHAFSKSMVQYYGVVGRV